MACCAAIALVFGLVRRAWGVITLRGAWTPHLVVPPEAWRPAPSEAGLRRAPSVASPPALGEATRERVVDGLRFFAGGVALYAGGVAGLLRTGAAQHNPAPPVGWPARDAVLVAAAAVALLAAVALERRERTGGWRDRLGSGLIGVGAAWLGFGIVDQHWFTLFAIGGGGLGWDVAFHGVGEGAMAAGLLALRAADRATARRSTVTA